MASEQSASDEWYLLRSDKQLGPYTFAILTEAVTNGLITKTDLVWRSGWSAWQPASSVPGLFLPPALVEKSKEIDTNTTSQALSDVTSLNIRPERLSTAPIKAAEKAGQSKSGNYLLRHWRGDLSLPISYWVNGILAIIVAYIIAFIFAAYIESAKGAGSATIAVALLLFLFALTALTLWQFVGIWRSASRHTERGGNSFWAGLAKVLVILGALRTIIDFSATFVPLITEHTKIALGDRKFGENHFRLLRNGTELEFSGGINIGTAKEFERMLNAASQVKVLHLNSHGGRIAEADLIAIQVRKRGLITYVSESCVSACTHIFLAGQERWISERGSLGFHRPDFPGLKAEDILPLVEQERRDLISMGLSAAFVSKALSTSSNSMWRPSHSELLAARAISGVVDGTRFAASGRFASSATADQMSEILLKIPLYATLQRTEPQAFEKIKQQLADGYKSGATEEEIISSARVIVGENLKRYLPQASDASVLESADIIIAYMDGLRNMDPESCVALADNTKGARLRANLTKQFPTTSRRELEVNNVILESGAQNSRSIPTEKQIEPYMLKVITRLAGHPELQLDLLDKSRLTPPEYKSYCEVGLALFQEIRRLPTNEATALLRHLYSLASP